MYLTSRERRPTLVVVFTVAEELGLKGAHALDVATLRGDLGFVFDGEVPVGEVIAAAVAQAALTLTVRGRRAHWMRVLPVSGDMIEDHIFMETGDGRVVIVIMESWSGKVVLAGDLLIPAGSALTLQPGTELRFPANATLTVDSPSAAGSPHTVQVFLRVYDVNGNGNLDFRLFLPLIRK